jgi:hypothetical protein
MISKKLRNRAFLVVALGVGALLTSPKPSTAAPVPLTCHFCGHIDSECNELTCDLNCGGVGSGAGCYEDLDGFCQPWPEVGIIDCGDAS